MQDFNIHSHTIRCLHAVGTDEEYVLKAIEAGIKTLGFSDHVPLIDDQGMGDRMTMNQVQEYIDSVLSLKEKYKNEIDIKLGFECEYFKTNLEHYRQLLNVCDYLILGHHYEEPNSIDYCEFCDDTRVLQYAESICAGIKSGLFTYLAHPDYFMIPRNDWSDSCTKAIEKIFICAKEEGIPIEINLKGMRYGKQQYSFGESFIYPNKKTVELLMKHRPMIVYGLDCHDPIHYLEMQDYITLFHNEYPEFDLPSVKFDELKIKK
ncbi:histidinol-phosphatase [Anaerorhabdus sp.]|uniref:histidinol-phosphatase n=1 Tax=Anaerorhabdus sp. TaxID=1872524 RepID=UPI002FCA86F4